MTKKDEKITPQTATPEQIRHLPHMREANTMRQLLKVVRLARPLIRPILRLAGKNIEKFDSKMNELIKMEAQVADLIVIPDRFNAIFSDRGWIMYEMLNFDVAKAAVLRAESGDIDGAEVDLVAYYTPNMVEWKLRMMRTITAFVSRMNLAEKALLDYTEERYYASVMVCLALLDGLVNELHEKRRGFFVNDAEVEALDSISAHSTGLQKLASLLGRTRKTTRIESMRIPFRHGIMHGMDLGFDNKMVAAKSWAALFAIREWAIRAEAGTLDVPQKKENNKTLRQTLREYGESQRNLDALKQRIDTWKPRSIVFDQDIPFSGAPEVFGEDTPERKLATFFEFWTRNNYGKMAECIPRSRLVDKSLSKTAKEVRLEYDSGKLLAYSFTELRDLAAAICEIDVQLNVQTADEVLDKTVTFRMVFEGADGQGTARGTEGGTWVVYSWQAGSL